MTMSDSTPGETSLPSADFSVRLLGYRPSDVNTWVRAANEQLAALRSAEAARLLRIRELELESEMLRMRVRDWETREEAISHQLAVARESFDRMEQDARLRVDDAEGDVERARMRAEQLIELQASVSTTLSTVVQQVTGTLAALSRQQPTHHARSIRSGVTRTAPVVELGPRAVSAAPAEPVHAVEATPVAEAAAAVTPDAPSAADVAEPVTCEPAATAPTPASFASAQTRAPGEASVEVEIVATGIEHYAELGQLERQLANVAEIVDLHIETFLDDEAVIQILLASSADPTAVLTPVLGGQWTLEPRAHPPGVFMHRRRDAAAG